jgi:1-deoxy-D-xylulose 5-phosphate reductoisomerase
MNNLDLANLSSITKVQLVLHPAVTLDQQVTILGCTSREKSLELIEFPSEIKLL